MIFIPPMPNDQDPAIQDVLAAEAGRIRAFLERDFAAVERLLADDLHYVHASSRIDTRAGLLASLRSGRAKYRAGSLADLAVDLHGDWAVVSGSVHWETNVEGIDRVVNARFLNVWKAAPSGWQLFRACMSPVQPPKA